MFDIYESTSAVKTILDLILDGITFEKVDVKKEESVERHSNVCELSFVPDTASKEYLDLSTCHENKKKSFGCRIDYCITKYGTLVIARRTTFSQEAKKLLQPNLTST